MNSRAPQEISCTRGPESKPGTANPAYPRQGHHNNTHTPAQTQSPRSPWAQRVQQGTLCAHPTPAGTRQRHLQGSDANSSSPVGSAAPKLPTASSWVGSAAPCFTACLPSAQAAAGCAGEECHCCQLLPAQRGRAAPGGSPALQPRSSAGGMPHLMKVNGTSAWQLQPVLSQSQQRGTHDSSQT